MKSKSITADELDKKFEDNEEDILEYFDTSNVTRLEDHQKLENLLKALDMNYHDIAEITGLKYNSVKTLLQPAKPLPRWLKVAIHVWEKSHQKVGG